MSGFEAPRRHRADTSTREYQCGYDDGLAAVSDDPGATATDANYLEGFRDGRAEQQARAARKEHRS